MYYKTDNSSKGSSRSKSSSNGTQKENSKSEMQSSKLMKLFEEGLKDIYWVEKALTKAIPKMIKKATSEELIDALENHLVETEEHISRVEQVFKILGKKATAEKCEAMEGIIKEAEGIIEESDEGVMRDAGIISAAQKVEHYEITSYGTLREFAETLGLNKAAELLESTLQEEKEADLKLSEIAMENINIEASKEEA